MECFYTIEGPENSLREDKVVVRTKEFGEPLIGDYRGVVLAEIRFSNDQGKKRAEELARIYCQALKKVTPIQPM